MTSSSGIIEAVWRALAADGLRAGSQHLIDVIRNSDAALSAVLCLAGRREVVTVVNLEDLRSRLADSLIELDRVLESRVQ